MVHILLVKKTTPIIMDMSKSTCPKWRNGLFDLCSNWVSFLLDLPVKKTKILVVGEFDNVYFGKCKVFFGGWFQN
jgi:hypothetical protein